MRHELGISPAIIVFENLSDMLSTLEEYAEFHNRAIERYRDRLGLLLRQREMKADGQVLQGMDPSAFKEMGIEQATGGSVEGGVLLSNRKKEVKKKEREGEDQGWLVFEAEDYSIKVAGVANGNSVASNEISVLFKIVEALNAKLMNLKTAVKIMSDFPSRGIRSDQRFIVIFRDGLPKQIIPTNESQSNQPRFRYAEEFVLERLESV